MKKVSVQCRHVRLAYGKTEVLKDVSLDIAPGEFFALLGPSGSGKSTLLRLIAGFNRHQHGQVLVDGLDVSPLPPWQRNIGMVFQNYALWPHMTVWDNVAFGLVERRTDKATLKSKVAAALDLVGLGSYAQRRPNQLSGGQQQRVALARTIVIEPQVLLLDEPLSNLDKTLRVQMRQELLAMQRRLGLTTIFVTHDQEEAMSTADRMAVLDQGVVQQVGTPTALYDHPANVFVAGFVGTMNLLPARVCGRSSHTWTLDLPGVGTWQLPAPADAPAGDALQLSFRPHSLRLVPQDAALEPGLLCLAGQVQGSEFLGSSTRYRVQVGPHSLAVDHAHPVGGGLLAPGMAVRLGLPASQLRLLAG
ncbi:MAG: ABC transporter ATP-binding protein [Rubrivivax sp.]|jgi:iron(III) transport system ATP-binding protein|nr:ABC transporter ATP-binding protein [Rubrivivax sp.]